MYKEEMDNRPIGILDSGVGGLTVWKEILLKLPDEATIYIGDSKNAPYGDKTPEEIFQLAKKLITFLLKKDVKLIVIACNVITTTSLERLRNEFKGIPLVGTVPVVKKAAEKTKKGAIGILSTNGTAKSLYQKHLIEQFASGLQVVSIGTNTLVPLVEKGIFAKEKVAKVLQQVVKPFQKAGVDVVALGCTHFPFLKKDLQEALGKDVLLLDSGAAIARQVGRILEKNKWLAGKKQPQHIIFTTGEVSLWQEIIKQAKLPKADIEQIILRESKIHV